MDAPFDPHIFKVDGVARLGGRVPMEQFLSMVADWIDALVLTERMSLGSSGAVTWTIDRVDRGSALAVVDYFPETEDGQAFAQRVISDNTQAINQIHLTGTAQGLVPPEAESKLVRIRQTGLRAGIPAVSVRYQLLTGEMHLTAAAQLVPQVLSSQSLGAVEGMLVSVSFAQSPRCAVRDWRTGDLIICSLASPLVDMNAVRQGLLNRVRISGLVTSRVNGGVSVSDVTDIHVIQAGEMLPTVDELIGSDMDLTAGESVDKWLNKLRDYAQ